MPWVPRIYAAIRRDFLPPFTTNPDTEEDGAILRHEFLPYEPITF